MSAGSLKLHDALVKARVLLKICTYDEDIDREGLASVLSEIDGAIKMKPRNCDKYGSNADILWSAYLKEASCDDDKHRNEAFLKWLTAKAKAC